MTVIIALHRENQFYVLLIAGRRLYSRAQNPQSHCVFSKEQGTPEIIIGRTSTHHPPIHLLRGGTNFSSLFDPNSTGRDP